VQHVLELLQNIRVASPCSANWEEMTGDDQSRFCGHCNKHVYNLSSMSSEAIARLIQEKEGKLCGRFYRRADGTILTADCPVGVHHRIGRKRRLAMIAGSLAGLLSLGGSMKFQSAAGTSTSNPPAKQERPWSFKDEWARLGKCVMGEMQFPARAIPPEQFKPLEVNNEDLAKALERMLYSMGYSPTPVVYEELPPPRKID
jgi:hypothetical protein